MLCNLVNLRALGSLERAQSGEVQCCAMKKLPCKQACNELPACLQASLFLAQHEGSLLHAWSMLPDLAEQQGCAVCLIVVPCMLACSGFTFQWGCI